MNSLKFVSVLFLVVSLGLINIQNPQLPAVIDREKVFEAINTYFEIRYEIFTDLKLTTFEQYVNEISNQNNFLHDELGKIEIELNKVKFYGLGYSQYKFYLDYQSVLLDSEGRYEVIVIEGHDVVFKILEEKLATPPISKMRNLQHKLILINEAGRWKVISDTYGDYLWRYIRNSGLSTSEFKEFLDNSNDLLNSGIIQQSTTCNLPPDSTSHAYNRNGAVTYAHQWATAPPPFNPSYYDFTNLGGDCTNFVSQAIHEGGNAPMVNFTDCGNLCIGTLGWFYTDLLHRAAAWTYVQNLFDFIVQYQVWSGGPEGCEVDQNSAVIGDIIQYEWQGDGEYWDHSVIIVDSIDMGYGNMLHLVASHTPEWDNYPYTQLLYTKYPNRYYRFLHIERIDGLNLHLPIVLQENPEGTGLSFNNLQNAYPIYMNGSIPNLYQPYPIVYPKP